MKVDFMIIGAMKCGTTTLSRILAENSDVCFSNPKEPHFFSKSASWKDNLDRYHQMFNHEGKIYGEGSTTYTSHPHFNKQIVDDIYHYNPMMKFIYIIRNPVERVISHYMHAFQRGYIKCSIDEAIEKVPIIIDTSRYYSQISPYLKKFSEKNIHIIIFEDFIKNQQVPLDRVAKYLEIGKFKYNTNIHANKTIGNFKPPLWMDRYYKLPKVIRNFLPFRLFGEYIKRNQFTFAKKPELSSEAIVKLRSLFEPEILKMEELTRQDLTYW